MPKRLSDLDTLVVRIESSVPTNNMERETRALLLRLARAHRAHLRRELANSRIKKCAAGRPKRKVRDKNTKLKKIANLVTQMVKDGDELGIALSSDFDAQEIGETLAAARELQADSSLTAEQLAKLAELIQVLQARLIGSSAAFARAQRVAGRCLSQPGNQIGTDK